MNCIFCQKSDLKLDKCSLGDIYSCEDCNSNQVYDGDLMIRYMVAMYNQETNTEFVITTDLEHKYTIIFKFDDAWRYGNNDSQLVKIRGTFPVDPKNAPQFLERILKQRAFL